MKNNSAGVAQLVELLTCNEEVARSIRVASLDKIWAGTQSAYAPFRCYGGPTVANVSERRWGGQNLDGIRIRITKLERQQTLYWLNACCLKG